MAASVGSNASAKTVSAAPWCSRTANRAPSVGILDFRLDKSFRFGRYGKVTGMMDIFNALNRGTVVNFRTTTGTTFQEVIALLDPRIIRFGVRYDF